MSEWMIEWMNERNTHHRNKFDLTYRYMMLFYIVTLISQFYWNQIKDACMISGGLLLLVFYCNYTTVKCSLHKMFETNACPYVCPIPITTKHILIKLCIQSKSMILWVMTACNFIVGHWHFGGTFCLHLQGWSENSKDVVRSYRKGLCKALTEISAMGRKAGAQSDAENCDKATLFRPWHSAVAGRT
jgi:hypothetical protein